MERSWLNSEETSCDAQGATGPAIHGQAMKNGNNHSSDDRPIQYRGTYRANGRGSSG